MKLLNLPNIVQIVERMQSIVNQKQQLQDLFYNEITEHKKAEFINEAIIIHAPVTFIHNTTVSNISLILNTYVHRHNLGYIGVRKLLIQLSRNAYEPDVCFFKKETADKLTKQQKLFPAPDFIAEVLSPSTAHNDRRIKFKDYEAHQVKEYWIVDTNNELIEQYHLELNKYEEYQYKLIKKWRCGETISCYAIEGLSFLVDAVFDTGKALEVDRVTARNEGKIAGKIEAENMFITNVLKQGFSTENTAKMTGLSLERVKEIADKLSL